MEGFYKLDENGSWLFAPTFVCAKDYRLEKDGNREEVDGWKLQNDRILKLDSMNNRNNTIKLN